MIAKALVLQRHACDVAASELFASGFGSRLVEAREARAIKGLVALLDALSKSIRTGERVASRSLRRAQVLLCFIFAFEGADLDQPAAARLNSWRHRLGFCDLGHGRSSLYRFGLG